MLSAMRLPLAILLMTLPAAAQTADRTATPPNPATAAPTARTGTYSIQNGELIVASTLR